MFRFRITPLLAAVLAATGLATVSNAEEKKKDAKPKKPKVIAGKADVLKHVPKKFATLVGCDVEKRTVSLRVEGEDKEREWPVLADAEIKVHGWWGRLQQLQTGDRVWVWFAIDRDKKPRAVWMLADEFSEQDIHGEPYVVKASEGDGITVHLPEAEKLKPRELKLGEGVKTQKVGKAIYVQTAGGILRRAVNEETFEALRVEQKDWLRQCWREDGLPGSVSVLHPLGGEMDVLLDHEAMRWARYLKPGAKVKLAGEWPVEAVVKVVRPWRERTEMRLVTSSGVDQLNLVAGQRVSLIVPEPPADVQASDLPTDIGRVEGRQARVDWFLATTYCTCGIQGDRCTGMFYILESCNRNACGMPNQFSREVAAKIDEGKTDLVIYKELLENRGRELWQPHLLR